MKLFKKIFLLLFLIVLPYALIAEKYPIKIDNILVKESIINFFEYIMQNQQKSDVGIEVLLDCYDSLKNYETIYWEDLVIVFPLLMSYSDEYCVYEQKLIGGDIGPAILLLNALRAQIDLVSENQMECCQLLEGDFQGTFSILFEVTQGLSSFDSTLELLLDVIPSLTLSIAAYEESTTMNIAYLQNSLVTCCTTISNDFQQTWTVLSTGFNNTYSSIADVKNTMVNDFVQTWSILGNTLAAFNTCCNALFNDFNGTWTLINTDFNQVISLLTTLTQKEGSCESLSISAPTTIISPGSYCLANNITGTITINANDVVIDLNDCTIFNGQIIVLGRNNVCIRNGALENAGVGPTAISIMNCSNVILKNLIIINPNDGIQCGQVTNLLMKDIIITGAQNNGIDIINSSTALRFEDFEIINTSSNAIYINANVQDITLHNGHIKFTNGLRGEIGFNTDNVKCFDIFIEGTPSGIFPVNFLGTSSNVLFNNVHVTDATQGIRLSTSYQGLFEKCTVKNIIAPSSSAASAFRIDNGIHNQFDSCIVFGITTTGSTTIDAFKMTNNTDLILKNCTVEGLKGFNGTVNGMNIASSQLVTINECMIQNIISGTQADGFHIQSTNNVVATGCTANSCSSNGYYFNNSINGTYIQCIANNCLLNGFYSSAATNMLYQYCYSNNGSGNGFNVSNAICGNCESSKNSGFGFNGNSTSTAYNCFAGVNTAGNYTAITDSVQTIGATGPKVGYSMSA